MNIGLGLLALGISNLSIIQQFVEELKHIVTLDFANLWIHLQSILVGSINQ